MPCWTLSGGEPTIFPRFHWMLQQLSATHRWAITSNMGADRWKVYTKDPIPGCVSWTASYHHSSKVPIDEFAEKCRSLGCHYPLSINIVDYHSYDAAAAAVSLTDAGFKVNVSPFEDVRDLNVAGPLPLTCNGGLAHVLIDPEGHVYKCLSQERRADRERWRLGNIFEGNIKWPKTRSACFIPCDVYYTLDPDHPTKDMWDLDVRPLDVPDGVDFEGHRKSFEVPDSPLKKFIQLSQWVGKSHEQARGDLVDEATSGSRFDGSEARTGANPPKQPDAAHVN